MAAGILGMFSDSIIAWSDRDYFVYNIVGLRNENTAQASDGLSADL